MMQLEKMLPLLRCPATLAPLSVENGELVSTRGTRYPIVNGKPILVCDIKPFHVQPPEQRFVSQTHERFTLQERFSDPNMIVVNLGSGNVLCEDPRVISVDVLPNTNVDLVCEAERLPFADNTIDHVSSTAVFEHVFDPIRAIKEVRRCLRAGGMLRIDTAFMQGYHGFPGHYFNMTPQAIETFMLDDFIFDASYAVGAPAVFHAVLGPINMLLEQLPEKDRAKALTSSLGDFVEQLRSGDPELWRGRVSEEVVRRGASNFIAQGIKPTDYAAKTTDVIREIGNDAWAALKRDYYSERMGAILDHGAVGFYKMRAVEDYGVDPSLVGAHPKDLSALLRSCCPLDPMSISSWTLSIERLRAEREALVAIRDQWIRLFLTAQSSSKQ